MTKKQGAQSVNKEYRVTVCYDADEHADIIRAAGAVATSAGPMRLKPGAYIRLVSVQAARAELDEAAKPGAKGRP